MNRQQRGGGAVVGAGGGGGGALATTPVQGDKDKGRSPGLSTSRTITDTIVGKTPYAPSGFALIRVFDRKC